MVNIPNKNSAKAEGDYRTAVCPAWLRWQSYSVGFGAAIGCEHVWAKPTPRSTPVPLLKTPSSRPTADVSINAVLGGLEHNWIVLE